MAETHHYTEATFAETYDLPPEVAQKFMGIAGTAKADLDPFILAMRNRSAMVEWMLNPAGHPSAMKPKPGQPK